jgi:hypothetical protein
MLYGRASDCFLLESRYLRYPKQRVSSERIIVPFSKENQHGDTNEKNALGSLPDVLDRARKRKSNLWVYRIRAFTNQPVWTVLGRYGTTFTVLDVTYILLALFIGAKGFAAGLLIGKLTAASIREIFSPPASAMIIIMPLWPVILAIVLDQIIS